MRARCLSLLLACGFLVGGVASADKWESRVVGHIGLAVPIVAWTPDHSRYLGDLSVRIPFGIGIQKTPALTVDFEAIVVLPTGDAVPGAIMIDPGITYNWGPIETGLRAAFQIEGKTAKIEYGLMPVLQKTWNLGGASYYMRLDFPFLFREQPNFTFQFHTGIAF